MSHSARPASHDFRANCAAAAAAALVAAMLGVLAAAHTSPAAGEPAGPATAPSTRTTREDARSGEIAAQRIVFVCDASGSMTPKLPTLRRELHKVVRNFRPSQQFNLIFFRDNEALALSRNAVVRADAEGKRAADRFIDEIETTSTSDPLPALQVAFGQAPELIFLLTDGDFPDNKAVLLQVRKLNPRGTVKVNTIAFTDEKNSDTEFLQLLEKIAKENGGVFKHVNVADLKE